MESGLFWQMSDRSPRDRGRMALGLDLSREIEYPLHPGQALRQAAPGAVLTIVTSACLFDWHAHRSLTVAALIGG